MGKRISSGLQSIVAVGAGNGGAITNAILTVPMPVGTPPQAAVKMVIRKISWYHAIGVNATLLIGYGDRTVAGSLFRQIFPPILMVNGVDDHWDNPPIMGNTREGFMIDTTAVTGTLGDIYIESPTAGIAGFPNNAFVILEVEVL